MGQMHTLGRTATTAKRDAAGTLRVTYHKTVVVEVTRDGTVTLRSGGWRTVTTKARMNQAANQYGLGFSVYQKKGEWFVNLRRSASDVLPFEDGMQFKSQ